VVVVAVRRKEAEVEEGEREEVTTQSEGSQCL
jgi:hypothetical protein